MLQTYNHELLVDIVRTAWLFLLTFSPAVRVFLNFDVIVPLLLFRYWFFVVVLKMLYSKYKIFAKSQNKQFATRFPVA